MIVVQSKAKMLETQSVTAARSPPPGEPERGEFELAAVLHALSDPVRLQIVAGLSDGVEHSCGSLKLPVTKSTCTHHFRVLREAGMIHQRQAGTSRLNSLRREDLEARFPGLLDTVLRSARLG